MSICLSIPDTDQQITYTAFHKADTVRENNYLLDFTYGPDRQRWKTVLKKYNVIQRTIVYAGNYETITEIGLRREISYINGPDGVVAIHVKQSGQADKIYYPHYDHLGSVVKITGNAAEVFKASYDAWGKRTVTRNTFAWHRGFTGHEHLDEFRLIDMNGRMYDPVLGRFLSPDPFVQIPDMSQNYNRYSYVLNNPLRYTDPNGEFIFSVLLPGVGTFIDAALWGAVIGGAGYTASVAFTNGGFNNWNWGQFGKSVGFGAASGVFTAGIGQAFGAVGSNGIAGEIGRAVSHGMSNGMMTGIQGGDFWTGFASGGLGSLAGSAFMVYGGSLANSTLGNYAFSGFAGGVGAELTGGDFWQGAAIGLMTAGLNHTQQGLNKLIYNKTFNRIGFVPLDENVGNQMANYKMRLRIWQDGDDLLSLMAETYNTLVDGNVVAGADASLMVNGEQVAAQALSLKGAYIYPTGGFRPIGNAYFQIPASGNVSINFRGGWTVYMPGGAAVPVYHPTTPIPININQNIVIR